MRQPVTQPIASRQALRLDYVDAARGLCLVWMIFAHTLSGVTGGLTSWLASLYPQGWSTTNFVMLSGFALATISGRRTVTSFPRSVNKWHHKGLRLLVIAYLSNALFTLLLGWDGGALPSVPYVQSVLSFQHPWTISAILIPTCFLLLAGDFLEMAIEFMGAPIFLAVVTYLEYGSWKLVEFATPFLYRNNLFNSLFAFDNFWFTFPLLHLFGLGVWAYALAATFKEEKMGWILMVGTLALAPFYFSDSLSPPFMYFFRFAATLTVGVAVARTRVFGFLPLLGRSSLLVFMLHRLVVPFGHDPAITIFVTVESCVLACYMKEMFPVIGRVLRPIGF